jgi:hypothetical protein
MHIWLNLEQLTVAPFLALRSMVYIGMKRFNKALELLNNVSERQLHSSFQRLSLKGSTNLGAEYL